MNGRAGTVRVALAALGVIAAGVAWLWLNGWAVPS